MLGLKYFGWRMALVEFTCRNLRFRSLNCIGRLIAEFTDVPMFSCRPRFVAMPELHPTKYGQPRTPLRDAFDIDFS